MIQEFITAISLGLIGGMIPGPVVTAIFTEILQTGFGKSFRIIFIALFTETLVALTSLLILASINLNESVFRGISFIGAGILIWIATSIWKVTSLYTEEKVRFGFWKIFAMILANGVLWTFWITICIPKAIFLGKAFLYGEYVFLGLVQLGWLISTSLLAFVFSRFRKLLSRPRVIPVIFKIFALAFVYFALDTFYNSLIFFIEN